MALGYPNSAVLPTGLPVANPPVYRPAPPVMAATPLGRPPVGALSPALADFIDFQTMIAGSKNAHLKDQKRVSVAKTSLFSALVAGGITAVGSLISAINGQSEKLFLIPIIGTFAALQGAAVGLLLNHNRD